MPRNAFGQPIGEAVPDWKPAQLPPRTPIVGSYCRLEPIDPARHAADLFASVSEDTDGSSFTYMGYAPFARLEDFRAWMTSTCLGDDPRFFAILDVGSNR